MNVFHISAECYPMAKVGGLADVVGALPMYQTTTGIKSSVVMPFYDTPFTQKHRFSTLDKGRINLGKTKLNYQVKKLHKNSLNLEVFFIDIPALLFLSNVYTESDTERFLAFQIAVLDWISSRKNFPSVMHCHDHHTSLIPFLMSHGTAYTAFREIPSILTIHNAQYQGWFSYDQLHLIPDFDHTHKGLLDWDGIINPLAAGIKTAWRVTTVSPSYMIEMQENANGLENLLKHERQKCRGILNGIDTEVWNPETDPNLLKTYGLTTVQSGKKATKKFLCDQFKLDSKKPLCVFIGRLVGEKGADLFPETFKNILLHHEVSILLLGSGQTEIETEIKKLLPKFKGQFNAHIGYDEQLAHRMYAGADYLLMPSRVEPCGLNQMYALRYGTIPIVHHIGGLKDTVIDISDGGFGIVHREVKVEQIAAAVDRAIKLYKNQEKYKKIRKLIMKIDHSWHSSAAAYIDLYNSLIFSL